ncbi:hypothetical protein HMPREF2936_11340 [Neisseria sp. HMSC064F04]|nr:hypothetical protein HMPREF2936_11340 [Neisseria sp. HMSC064F04]
MGNVAFACNQVVTFVIDHKWVIISILVVLVILGWVCLRRKSNNVWKVIYAGICSIILGFLLLSGITVYDDTTITKITSPGFWNFIILIVSAPVAFAIWHFRDENNRQQIENQRKDINLKEFQKLSEWVSGAHLPEIKTVSKTTQKSSPKDEAEITEQTTEQSEEYAKKPETTDFDTFSKRDGAVALQISAIYNLLPFFRGDYGESFRRPAFNLLKSAWQAMQQESLKKLDGAPLSDEERKKIFDELTHKAKSPMGMALTQVLLSLNRENKKLNLRDFPEMLPNICLAGMDFHLIGVDEIARDLSGLNLQGANFQKTNLEKIKLQGADLIGANFRGANLKNADLHMEKWKSAFDSKNINFQKANLSQADLQNRDLTGSNFQGANLLDAKLQGAALSYSNLRGMDFKWWQIRKSRAMSKAEITEHDFIKHIYPRWKEGNNPEWETLTEDEQKKAMQQFCKETWIRIFDEEGKRIMPPPKKHKI